MKTMSWRPQIYLIMEPVPNLKQLKNTGPYDIYKISLNHNDPGLFRFLNGSDYILISKVYGSNRILRTYKPPPPPQKKKKKTINQIVPWSNVTSKSSTLIFSFFFFIFYSPSNKQHYVLVIIFITWDGLWKIL